MFITLITMTHLEYHQRKLLVAGFLALLLALSLSFRCNAFTLTPRLRLASAPSRPTARDERLVTTTSRLVKGDELLRPAYSALLAKPLHSRSLLSFEGPVASMVSPIARAMGIAPRTAATGAAAAIGALSLGVAAYGLMSTSSMPHNHSESTVSQYFDSWAQDGILESTGGEHAHFGFYSDPSSSSSWGLSGRSRLDQARCNAIDKACEFAGLKAPAALVTGKNSKPKHMNVLDVGCGVGGSARYLATKLSSPLNHVSVLGLSVSPQEISRARAISESLNISDHTVRFECMDASGCSPVSAKKSQHGDAEGERDAPHAAPASSKSLARSSFDLIWAAESAEYMPDKTKFVNEMFRLLKPGGRLIVLAKCRGAPHKISSSKSSFLDDEESIDPAVEAIEKQWGAPPLVSKERYLSILRHTDSAAPRSIRGMDWTNHTIVPTYRNLATSIILQPWHVLLRPWRWLHYLSAGAAAIRASRAASQGSLEFAVFTATKRAGPESPSALKESSPAPRPAAKKAPVKRTKAT